MAKNPFWLRGANGKLAGAVVYQSGGKTIIRENVSPSNPQTIPQIVQRLAFATVSKAASILGNLVDHSFEGIKPGPDSKRYFIKRNVGIVRQKLIDDYINKNVGSQANAFVQAKSTSALIPNSYMISSGSLPALFRIVLNDGAMSLVSPLNGWFGNAGESTLLDVISAYGLQPGDEISLHVIAAKYNATDVDFPPLYTVPEGARAGGVIIESEYKGVRVVLQDANWEGWQTTIPTVGTIDEPPTEQAATAAMKEFLFGADPIFNMDKSDADFVAAFANTMKFIEDAQIGISGPVLQWRVKPATDLIPVGSIIDPESMFDIITASAAILSRVVDGDAKRSPAIMTKMPMDDVDASTWYGLDIWSALESFTDKSLTDLFREWLDKGGQRNTLT